MTYLIEKHVPLFSIPDASLATLRASDGYSAVRVEDGSRMTHAGGVWSPVSTPAGTPPAYLGQVATHCQTPTNLRVPAGATQANSRSRHIAIDDVINPRLVLDNWYGITETGPGGISTETASIESPVGTFTQVTFSGSATGTIANGGRLISDPVAGLTIRAGSTFYVRRFIQNAAGFCYYAFGQLSGQGSIEALAQAVSGLSDQTMGGTITTSAAGYLCPPSAILGMTQRPSIFVAGDSRANGMETAGTSGIAETGCIVRSFATGPAYINASMSSMAGSQFAASPMRIALAQYCSHVLCEYGTNDLAAGVTSAALIATIQGIQALCGNKPFYQTTIYPRTTSTDSWATTTNQTPIASESQRIAFNTAVRAGGLGFTGYIEQADVYESARNSGFFIVNGTANFYTTDGIHGTTAANVLMTASDKILASQFAR